MRRLTTLLLIAVASATSARALTLEEAVTLGLEHNFDIRIARAEAESADLGRGLGRAGFLPRLSADGAYALGWQTTDADNATGAVDSDTETLRGEVSLSWTIFDGREMFIANGRYRELAELGAWRARLAIEGQVAAVSRAYNNLVLQRQLLASATETLELSAVRLEQTRTRQELGGAGQTELLNAQVAWNADRAALLAQELEADIARRDLNLLLGRDHDAALDCADDISLPSLDPDAAVILDRALSGNSRMNLMVLNHCVAARDVASARADYWPTLSFGSSYGYSDVTRGSDDLPADVGTATRDLDVSLRLSFDLFDGGYRRVALQRAQVAERIARLEEQQTRADLENQVGQAIHSYEQKLTLAELEAENVAVARRNLDLQERLYEMGAGTSLEFRDAQLSLDGARTSALRARYQAWSAGLEIEQLSGALLD